MVSSDSKRILALVIVTVSIISVPVLLFFLAFTIYLNMNEIIQYYQTKALANVLMAILLGALNVCLFFAIRALIKWLRR